MQKVFLLQIIFYGEISKSINVTADQLLKLLVIKKQTMQVCADNNG